VIWQGLLRGRSIADLSAMGLQRLMDKRNQLSKT